MTEFRNLQRKTSDQFTDGIFNPPFPTLKPLSQLAQLESLPPSAEK